MVQSSVTYMVYMISHAINHRCVWIFPQQLLPKLATDRSRQGAMAAAAFATAMQDLAEEYDANLMHHKKLMMRMHSMEEFTTELQEGHFAMFGDWQTLNKEIDDVRKDIDEVKILATKRKKDIDHMKMSIGLIAHGNSKIAEHLGSTPEAVMLVNPDGKDDGKKRKNIKEKGSDDDLILSEKSGEEEEVQQEHQPNKSKKDEGDASG